MTKKEQVYKAVEVLSEALATVTELLNDKEVVDNEHSDDIEHMYANAKLHYVKQVIKDLVQVYEKLEVV